MLGEPLPGKWISVFVLCYSGFQAMFTEPLPSSCHIRHNTNCCHKHVSEGVLEYEHLLE
jgi:hypothetical protein